MTEITSRLSTALADRYKIEPRWHGHRLQSAHVSALNAADSSETSRAW